MQRTTCGNCSTLLACDEVRAGYRKHSVVPHAVYYRLTGHDVEIVRILHQRMDVDRQLSD
ncbi:type II toxin-antitoxin system RelE/ParE family toxin [Mycobacteroides abscessus subsp. abscessus]|jgi:toxin ParE1/3/4|nr:type II toxin-antitoxin system RelE/ParE family toxin [Mycobacteroides abscessus subsp. abscessus]